MKFLNKKIFLVSLISAVLIFIGLIFLEKSLAHYTPTIKVLYVSKDIKEKDLLNEKDFEVKDIPITAYNSNYVKSKAELKNMCAKENIYSGEPMSTRRMIDKNSIDSYKLKPGEVEMSLSFTNPGDVVGGTLRSDDIVKIISSNQATAKEPYVKTTTVTSKCVRILKSMDNTGKVIDKYDKNSVATIIVIAVSLEDSHIIENSLKRGSLAVIKADKENENSITVIDGQLQNAVK